VKKKKRIPKWLKISLISLFFVLIFIGVAFATILYRSYNTVVVKTPDYIVRASDPEASLTPSLNPYEPFNVLLLGHGGPGHDGGDLTDTMIVAHIRPEDKKIILISLPRDTWVEVPVSKDKKEMTKINAAYAIGKDEKKYPDKEAFYKGEAGAGNLAKEATEKVTGLSIAHFVAVNFNGFMKAIDLIGGIEVDVPHTFEDNFYPIKGLENETCGLDPAALTATMSGFQLEKQFTCRYETLSFTKGKTTMDGITALKFVRSRHSETHGGDFARSERQKAVIKAVRSKVLSLGILNDFVPLLNKLSDSVRTDIDIATARTMLSIAGDPRSYEISSITLSTDNVFKDSLSRDRQYILIPKGGEGKFEGVEEYIKKQINLVVTPPEKAQ
jgi:polyisoprenyl-teichoic acid--peptidoglycan teichoic acid transferase